MLPHLRCQSRMLHRVTQMASHLSNGQTNGVHTGTSIRDLPKSSTFTSRLPADQDFPTPTSSHKTPRNEIGPKLVRNALFTYVRPETNEDPKLLGTSKRALKDLGISEDDVKTQDFLDTVSGNKILTWDEQNILETEVQKDSLMRELGPFQLFALG